MSGSERSRTFLVECYWPGVDEERLATAEQRARRVAAELTRGGHAVAFIGSVLVPADETVFCFFKGCEADVREASERANMPFERVLEAASDEVFDPRHSSESRSSESGVVTARCTMAASANTWQPAEKRGGGS